MYERETAFTFLGTVPLRAQDNLILVSFLINCIDKVLLVGTSRTSIKKEIKYHFFTICNINGLELGPHVNLTKFSSNSSFLTSSFLILNV